MARLESIIPVLEKICVNDEHVAIQLKRYGQLVDLFKDKHGEGDLHYFSTPGRTEIGGNHTDHNNGRVIAASVDIDSIAVAARNNSGKVNIYSEGYEGIFKIDLNDLNKNKYETGKTIALIRGIAAGFKAKGFKVGGFNACITSDILPGSGLSSSASIEVLIGSIINGLFNDSKIAAEELAKIGQYAENEFFGKPCGLMDQLTCAIGGILAIDFKNPLKPQTQKIDFNFSNEKYHLLVVDSGGNHADLTEDYNSIPKEMKAVARLFNKENCREISNSVLNKHIKKIRQTLGDRPLLRVLHFFEENERVLKQIIALEKNRFNDFLKLVTESGNSSFKWLQNVYSAKNLNDQGVSVALALTENFIAKIGQGACRVHGGGFAGTIQAFIPEKYVKEYKKFMEPVLGKSSVKLLKIRSQGTLHLNKISYN